MRSLIIAALLLAGHAQASEPVRFGSWSPELFARARAQHRFVLLDLAAVWCHWCHVMDETTYRDATVARLIGERFIAVRADQDADPELSARYEEWGWPATIVFAPDGSELVKRRGYLLPEAMASLLQAIVDDPTPGPSVRPEMKWAPSTRTHLTAAQRQKLEQTFGAAFDRQWAGFGSIHKFVDAAPLEYALSQPRHADKARRTLDAALQLIDPVWGGMYQYSDALDWSSPHYEKIMSVQTQAIELYVAAYQRWHDARYLAAARAIAGYLDRFLGSPDGAFYTSQDADLDGKTPGKAFYALDDAGRRALGQPHVDTSIYPRENGWAVRALVALYAATKEEAWLTRARRAVAYVEARRALPDGGFRHGAADRAGPYLADTLAMAEAYARLAEVEPSGPWRDRAVAAASFIERHFADSEAGFVSAPVAAGADGVLARPTRLVEENVAVARLMRRLGRASADHAMRFLTSATLLEARPFSPGVLLADRGS